MPKVILTNDGIKETVIRPVVLALAKQVQAWTGLGPSTVLFNGDSEVAPQPGSKIDADESFNYTSSRALWRVTATDEHITDRLQSTAVHQMEHPEFFYDEPLRVFMRPVYSPTTLRLDFEYRAVDVSAARRWRDEVRTKVSLNRDVRLHDVEYSYFVPSAYFPLLKHLHTLRETQAGYGDTHEAWLKQSFTQNVTLASDMVGNHQRWAVREQQNRIIGHFDFADIPDKPEKANEGSSYTLTFSYTVQFDCPIATAMDYPLMVHNQLIDEVYWGLSGKDPILEVASRSSISQTALGIFEVPYSHRHVVETGRKFPEISEFLPKYKHTSTYQVFSALLGMTPINPAEPDNHKLAMNFREIDSQWELHPEFLAYMAWDYQKLCQYGESFVNVSVYSGDLLLDPSHYFVDSDLNLWFTTDPDLRQTYYVRLSLLADPSLLSQGAKDSLTGNGEGLILIGGLLCPDLIRYQQAPEVIGDNFVPLHEVNKFLNKIRQCRRVSGESQGILATVNLLFLQAERNNPLEA